MNLSSQTYFYSDYLPFGMQMPDRESSPDKYRYGFQGQEVDNEVKGYGNSVNYKYRMHDPRIGRFFAVDPLAASYPYNSPYAFSENRVIDGVELEGLEVSIFHDNIDKHLLFNIIHSSEILTETWEAVNDPTVKMEVHYRAGDILSTDRALGQTTYGNIGRLARWALDHDEFVNSLSDLDLSIYINTNDYAMDVADRKFVKTLLNDLDLDMSKVAKAYDNGYETAVVTMDNKVLEEQSDIGLKVVTKAFLHETDAHLKKAAEVGGTLRASECDYFDFGNTSLSRKTGDGETSSESGSEKIFNEVDNVIDNGCY